MTHPMAASADWARQTLTSMANTAITTGNTISSWLVLGNAGALVISFGAILSGTTCNQSVLADANARFAWGLFLGVSAVTIGYAVQLASLFALAAASNILTALHSNTFYIDLLEEQGIEVLDDNPLKLGVASVPVELAALNKRIAVLALALVCPAVLGLASAVAFGLGVAIPVSAPAAVFASCSANTARTDAVKPGVKLPTSK
jgi:hypothetical protein